MSRLSDIIHSIGQDYLEKEALAKLVDEAKIIITKAGKEINDPDLDAPKDFRAPPLVQAAKYVNETKQGENNKEALNKIAEALTKHYLIDVNARRKNYLEDNYGNAVIEEKEYKGEFALFYAVKNPGNGFLVELLLKHNDLNIFLEYGRTAAHTVLNASDMDNALLNMSVRDRANSIQNAWNNTEQKTNPILVKNQFIYANRYKWLYKSKRNEITLESTETKLLPTNYYSKTMDSKHSIASTVTTAATTTAVPNTVTSMPSTGDYQRDACLGIIYGVAGNYDKAITFIKHAWMVRDSIFPQFSSILKQLPMTNSQPILGDIIHIIYGLHEIAVTKRNDIYIPDAVIVLLELLNKFPGMIQVEKAVIHGALAHLYANANSPLADPKAADRMQREAEKLELPAKVHAGIKYMVAGNPDLALSSCPKEARVTFKQVLREAKDDKGIAVATELLLFHTDRALADFDPQDENCLAYENPDLYHKVIKHCLDIVTKHIKTDRPQLPDNQQKMLERVVGMSTHYQAIVNPNDNKDSKNTYAYQNVYAQLTFNVEYSLKTPAEKLLRRSALYTSFLAKKATFDNDDDGFRSRNKQTHAAIILTTTTLIGQCDEILKILNDKALDNNPLNISGEKTEFIEPIRKQYRDKLAELRKEKAKAELDSGLDMISKNVAKSTSHSETTGIMQAYANIITSSVILGKDCLKHVERVITELSNDGKIANLGDEESIVNQRIETLALAQKQQAIFKLGNWFSGDSEKTLFYYANQGDPDALFALAQYCASGTSPYYGRALLHYARFALVSRGMPDEFERRTIARDYISKLSKNNDVKAKVAKYYLSLIETVEQCPIACNPTMLIMSTYKAVSLPNDVVSDMDGSDRTFEKAGLTKDILTNLSYYKIEANGTRYTRFKEADLKLFDDSIMPTLKQKMNPSQSTNHNTKTSAPNGNGTPSPVVASSTTTVATATTSTTASTSVTVSGNTTSALTSTPIKAVSFSAEGAGASNNASINNGATPNKSQKSILKNSNDAALSKTSTTPNEDDAPSSPLLSHEELMSVTVSGTPPVDSNVMAATSTISSVPTTSTSAVLSKLNKDPLRGDMNQIFKSPLVASLDATITISSPTTTATTTVTNTNSKQHNISLTGAVPMPMLLASTGVGSAVSFVLTSGSTTTAATAMTSTSIQPLDSTDNTLNHNGGPA